MKLGSNINKFVSQFNGDVKRVFILNDINGIYNVQVLYEYMEILQIMYLKNLIYINNFLNF